MLAKTIPRRLPKAGTKAVIVALGPEVAESVFAAFEASATGRRGLQMLADQSPGGGLDFADELVIGQIELLATAGAITADARERLLGLGVVLESAAERSGLTIDECSAEECEAAVRADRLAARIVNATALANERLSASQTAEQQAAVWAQAWQEAI